MQEIDEKHEKASLVANDVGLGLLFLKIPAAESIILQKL
jgi:hypothetical protein